MVQNQSVSFRVAFYNEATQYLEASTICSGGTCGEYTNDRRHFGFIYSKPDPHGLISSDPQRPIPILLKAETIDTSMPSDLARKHLLDDMKAFLASADFDTLTQPYRRR
jgi:exosortase J